jgi:hypothetical protein
MHPGWSRALSKLNPIVLGASLCLKEVHQQSLPVVLCQLLLMFQSFPFQLLLQVLQDHEKEGLGLFDSARHT